jgi:hypothetical protein
MTIAEADGTVSFPEIESSVSSSLSRSQFLRTPAFREASILVKNEPWCSFYVRGIPHADTELGVRFQFFGERLDSLDISNFADPSIKGRADVCLENLRASQRFHEQWMADEVGVPVGSYRWGVISSYGDIRGGGSGIIIQY